MRILSIETSADETGVTLLEIEGDLIKPAIKVLGNSLASQIALHEQYGGIYPMMAKREHEKNLPLLLAETLRQAGENEENPNIDFIAVTTGPGLAPALWTGIVFAQELGKKWGKPIIPVNHMEGHIFSVLKDREAPLALPALALLVSGGHTELVHVKDFDHYEIIGHTVDDAVGEAYDKVARMLGLAYPGGPKISALADKARREDLPQTFAFPRPMIHSGNLNFSYSGLKTAVLYKLRDEGRSDDAFKEEVARAFEDSAVDVLVEKTQTALDELGDIKTLIIAGGVSANTHLQGEMTKLKENFNNLEILFPANGLSTDNAVMIGIAGYIQATLHPEKLSTGTEEILKAEGNLSINS